MPNSGKQDGVDFGYFCEQAKQMKRIANSFPITVAYPNLQIREGPGHPDPELGRGGGDVRERRRESKLQEPRLLHFAPYFNYPSCHFNDQSELGVRFYA